MSYCSDTLKEIFLELPLPAGGIVAAVVDMAPVRNLLVERGRCSLGWEGSTMGVGRHDCL